MEEIISKILNEHVLYLELPTIIKMYPNDLIM